MVKEQITAETETKTWSKEFPQVEGFYWARRTQTNAPQPKIIEVWQYEGDWYAYRHGDSRDIEAEDFTKSLYEYLGPISPSDTEQLVRLRQVVRDYLNVDPAQDVTRYCELERELEQLVGIEAEMKGEQL